MRLLLLNQFYPPDQAPTGRMLHDLARELVRRGHDVAVVCSRRGYDGGTRYAKTSDLDGVQVRRLAAPARSRLGGYLAFLAGAAAHVACTRPRPDVVLSLTTPPFLGLLGRLARGRGAVPADWIMDVYPDALSSHGWLRPGSHAYALLRWLARQQLGASRLAIVLGPGMAARIGAYAGPHTEILTVPLWSSEGRPASEETSALRKRRGWPESELVLLYSGHLGLAHRVDLFLEAARRLGGGGPVWAFAGGGPRRVEIEQFKVQQPGARVQLLEPVAELDLPASLASADVHLVSLRGAWSGVVVPSKLQAAFAAARPVIFVGPPESEAALWIAASGGGWIVGEDDLTGLLRAVEEAREHAERTRRGAAALLYARQHFDRVHNTAVIAERLAQLRPHGAV